MPVLISVQEKDIRTALATGGSVRGCFFVARRIEGHYEFLAYIRPSWYKAYLPMRTWLGKADRTYKDVGRLLQLVRDDFGFVGVVSIYVAGSPELARFKGVLPEDAPPPGMVVPPSPCED